MNEISIQRLRTHVYELAGKIGEHNVFHPDALHAAEAYITQEWRQQGYDVRKQTYTAQGVECANLEITRAGNGRNNDVILIGAHYDSVLDSPGANDNGSGVAALLELSRLFKDVAPETSLRFVAFVNEEPPFFFWPSMGSMVYAKAARQRSDPIRFMISLETIGYYRNQRDSQTYPPLLKHFYPDTGNFIAFVSNLRSRHILRDCVQAFSSATDFPVQSIAAPAIVPGVSLSDQLAFWRHGYKALMITDTAFYRYPYYHTAQDTPDKLDYEPFTEMTKGLFLMLCRLANAMQQSPESSH
ncbi:M28 family peptidase [Methylobacter sp.]|uniref:M28 family peptidase n=1 Tax=Methylobacter sp. TaxID=2051955 RepID=UPI00248957AE|nr:M28 family peptidase [Methylobacter sp.]MDI1279209.1 M28 family peptidase [Methylobacter sp.]MDI1357760.1 M28 family peptidase [Methylobacter sp.]